MIHTVNDLTNYRSGRLVALRCVGSNSYKQRLWQCVCDCGDTTIVVSSHLKYRRTQSCGCINREETRRRNTKHGLAQPGKRHPDYQVWTSMRTRCNNPNYKQYADYGGRGIKVCERWNSFTNFIADMGPRPKGYSIERIDVDGDYEPANCKWANAKEQCRNKRNNHFIEYQGHMITGIEYREITGLSRWKTYNQRSVLK